MSPRLISAVVYLLGAALLSCIAGIVLLAVLSKPQPEILSQVVIGSLTGLAGILAAQRGTADPAAPAAGHRHDGEVPAGYDGEVSPGA